MNISPDDLILWERGFIRINGTLLYSWAILVLLVLGAWLSTRGFSDGSRTRISRWQILLEVLVEGMRRQVRDVSLQEPGLFLPFVGTLFLYIATSNLLIIVPGYHPPTGSLSTTTALALCVFVAVPFYSVARTGLMNYFRGYVRPSVFMLPFNLISDVSRTLALAIRLYGNVMSGTVIVGILVSIVPFFFPIVLQVLGLLTGLIQAYIFAILAMVYIASATRVHQRREDVTAEEGSEDG